MLKNTRTFGEPVRNSRTFGEPAAQDRRSPNARSLLTVVDSLKQREQKLVTGEDQQRQGLEREASEVWAPAALPTPPTPACLHLPPPTPTPRPYPSRPRHSGRAG